MSEELENLEYMKFGGPTEEEMDKLDGTRVKIASCEVVDGTTGFGLDGQLLPEGQERAIKMIKMTTEQFGTEQIERAIEHIESYNLKNIDNKWVVGLHEKSKTAQFLAKYKLDKFTNVIGTEVVLVKKVNPKNNRGRLRISI